MKKEMVMTSKTFAHSELSHRVARAQGLFQTAFSAFARVLERLRERRDAQSLLTMSDFELKDVGLTRGDVYREAMKPILWD
jgi:uncharacterized protein YjiS (DUF1127 family)